VFGSFFDANQWMPRAIADSEAEPQREFAMAFSLQTASVLPER
jgi:hypothetical protein